MECNLFLSSLLCPLPLFFHVASHLLKAKLVAISINTVYFQLILFVPLLILSAGSHSSHNKELETKHVVDERLHDIKPPLREPQLIF